MRRRSNIGRRLALTPLIDVIFLLLLFFMLSSTFTRFAEVPLAQAGTGAPGETTPQLFVRVTADGVTLNGAPVAGDLADAVMARSANAQRTALLAVGPDASSQAMVDALVALKSVKDLTVSVIR